MDRQLTLQHLVLANQHLADAALRIADHRARVARLAAAGRDTTDALKLLALLQASYSLMLAHRATIVAELTDTP